MKLGTLNHSRNLPTEKPMQKPTPTATAMPITAARSPPIASVSAPQIQATMQPASAAPAPTDRSISPEMITAVMPKAMMPRSAPVRRTLRRFRRLAKPGAVKTRTTISTTRITSIG